jgi:glyoxylate reductase
MSTFNVFITRKIAESATQLLQARGYTVDMPAEDNELSHKQLKTRVAGVDALIPLLSDTIDREIMDNAPKLKIIANYAVGFNNIDVAYARSKKIMVTNTPEVLTDATADLTWTLLLGVTRRIVEGDRFCREGRFSGWGPLLLLGGDVAGKTLGIIGAGRIGQAVGYRARGFRMNMLYSDPQARLQFEKECAAKRVSTEELLTRSDFISLHCPLNEQTRHLINAQNIFSIKKGAYLINTARGPLIEEQALVKALQQDHLGGAGLDVYEFEPRISDALLGLSNVVLLPHIGSATLKTRSDMARIAAQNVINFLEKGQALTPVY